MKKIGKSYGKIGIVFLVLAAAAFAAGLRAEEKVIPAMAPDSIIMLDPPEPMIHGPRIVGTTPGKPFLFLIPATGEGALSFAASDLPEGLSLDGATGIISGSVKSPGAYRAKITVSGAKGEYSRSLAIVAAKDRLALTPPMGWNSWNAWGLAVSDEKVRSAADAMISSGLAAKGYQFVNIDDGWEAGRHEDGTIKVNDKFPDMKALGDYIHSRGLKFGIYSSPGPLTCGKHEGSKGHEAQDAASYAAWGVDYLKYDWCSYKIEAREAGLKVLSDRYIWFKTPYQRMGDLLRATNRDIVYAICFYGLWNVGEWGPGVGGNLWRTTGDITDTWTSMSTIGFGQGKWQKHGGPGHWNDPDMLVVGKVGWGPNLHPTRLTKDEQITHITLWSLLASPLLIGCDMAEMDEFTIAVLTNSEVVAVDQDPLGIGATRKSKSGSTEVWARPLWDGTIAVGLFNRGDSTARATADWDDLGRGGSQPVRNLWTREDLGVYGGSVTVEVPAHGAVLLKIGKPEREDFSGEGK